MENKKIISSETIKNIYKKERRGDIIGYIALSVITIMFVVTGIMTSENSLQSVLICLGALGMIAMLVSVEKTRKKKKATYIDETNYKIVEAYLVYRKSVPGSGEGTWYDCFTFWCGEKYGMLEAISGNDAQLISAKIFGNSTFSKKSIDQKFYVFLKYSILKSRYEISLAFSAYKYELDDKLKTKLMAVPESEYEEVKNRTKSKNTESK